MIRKKRLIFILIYSVFFLFSCGIPRMIPWTEEQYEIGINQLKFKLSFNIYEGTINQQPITLEPLPDTPVLRFLYVIVPYAENNSSVNNLINTFNSLFSDGFPPTYSSFNKPVVSTTATYSSEQSIRVSLFELTVFDGQSFVPTSTFFKGMDFYTNDGDWNTIKFDFGSIKNPNGDGFYITLTINNRDTYYLARADGQPFSQRPESYEDNEFLPDDKIGSDFQIRVYAAASFIFKNYTTKLTITSGSSQNSGYVTIPVPNI